MRGPCIKIYGVGKRIHEAFSSLLGPSNGIHKISIINSFLFAGYSHDDLHYLIHLFTMLFAVSIQNFLQLLLIFLHLLYTGSSLFSHGSLSQPYQIMVLYGVTPQIRDVTGQRQTYTYASEALTYYLLIENSA